MIVSALCCVSHYIDFNLDMLFCTLDNRFKNI
jgi:hypothetical protein